MGSSKKTGFQIQLTSMPFYHYTKKLSLHPLAAPHHHHHQNSKCTTSSKFAARHPYHHPRCVTTSCVPPLSSTLILSFFFNRPSTRRGCTSRCPIESVPVILTDRTPPPSWKWQIRRRRSRPEGTSWPGCSNNSRKVKVS